jgi:replication-associated recombination protein RarA
MGTGIFEVGASAPMQVGFTFPESLSDKYKPKRVADFMQAFPRKVMLSLLASPKPSAWFFLGASGLGKTEMALDFANELPAQVHHIASKDCDLEAVRKIKLACNYVPHDDERTMTGRILREKSALAQDTSLRADVDYFNNVTLPATMS